MKSKFLLLALVFGMTFMSLGCEKVSQEEVDQAWENMEFFYDQREKQVDSMLQYMEKEEIALDAVAKPLREKMDNARNAAADDFETKQAEFSRVLRNGFEILFSIPEYSQNKTIIGFATLIGKTEAEIGKMAALYNAIAPEKFNAVLGNNTQ